MDPEAPSPSDSLDEQVCEELLAALLQLPAKEAAAILDRLSGSHTELSRRLARRLTLLSSQVPDLQEDEWSDDSSLSVRRQFGRFQLLERLGGNQTEVHLARDPQRTNLVVIKLARPDDQEARRAVEREARALELVSHPCVSDLLESGNIDSSPYLLLSFLEGLGLDEWIRQRMAKAGCLGSADLDLALGWLIDVAEGLGACHAAGIVHGDVKPENILVPLQGKPRLVDFGSCHMAEAEPVASHSGGTLAYLAPEVLLDPKAPVEPSADVYALGLCLLECVSLRPPFQGDTREAVVRQILSGRIPLPRTGRSARDCDLRRVVAMATAKRPSSRYATASHFADDLRRLLAGERVLAPRTSLLGRTARKLRSHPLVVVPALLLACTVLGGVFCWIETAMARTKTLDLVQLLEIPSRVRIARREADLLVPGWPHQSEALGAWLQQYDEPLLRLVPVVKAHLDRARAEPAADTLLVAALSRALTELEAHSSGPRSTLNTVRERLAWSRQVAERTIESHREAWASVSAQIAEDPRYGGLVLEPQFDLVPLGKDPVSGLFEFHHLRSAWPSAPAIERADGSGPLVRNDGTGLVFVLVPPGSFLMGHQGSDPSAANYDPDAGQYARPHRVELDAFFVSKYEMTQGQWWQLTGTWPSGARVGRGIGLTFVTPRHPVECVTALECERELAAVGLLLPTEAQWEYSAGAGAGTRFWFGEDETELGRHANLRDETWNRISPTPHYAFDDSYVATAPAGAYRPNPFGLCDCLGNVQEWCRDYFQSYENAPPRPSDGLRTPTGERRIVRGGSFSSYRYCSTQTRRDEPDDRRQNDIGVRPVRQVHRGGPQ